MKLLEWQIQLTNSSGESQDTSECKHQKWWASLVFFVGLNYYYVLPIFNFCLSKLKCKNPKVT